VAESALAPTGRRGVAFGQIYFAFAAAYLLSYLFRTVNAVIYPELARDLALPASSLGLLTSAYLFAFGAMQLPVGMLLDRYGPRRVEPVLMLMAGVGAWLFAAAETVVGLTIGRAVIGLGVCACLMAPLKAISAWYPMDRQTSLAGWMMVAGGVGALAATTPLEWTLHVLHWRTIFIVLGAAAVLSALGIWWRVPDLPAPAQRVGLAAQWAVVQRVFAHPRFWWIAPLAALGMGSFMAIQGLWAVPWLMEVAGETRAGAARHLLAMGVLILLGYVALGALGTRLARRGVHARHLFAGGFFASIAAFACIVLRVPGGYLWWTLFGLGASVNVLAFTVLNEGFGRELTGRTNTTLNLLMFGASFLIQWGLGVIVDAVRLATGADTASGLRVAFAVVLALDVAGYAWFVRGWRRHAAVRPHAVAA
jgi:predicted MFS family arabinose efflux permease